MTNPAEKHFGSVGEKGQMLFATGENNMGRVVMQLLDFMVKECTWEFLGVNSGNLGSMGHQREAQLRFRAPAPQAAPIATEHLLVELRQIGAVEVVGADVDGVHARLSEWLQQTWRCEPIRNDPEYHDLKFKCPARLLDGSTPDGEPIFDTRGAEGENNVGLRTMELVGFMATIGWGGQG